MEDKIVIIWIEDNPLINGISAEEFIKRHPQLSNSIDENSHRLFPAMTLENKKNEKDGSMPKPLVKGDEYRFFRLRILQNLEEAREYYSTIGEIEDNHGPEALGAFSEVIPNIVAFDYKMMEGNNIEGGSNIPYRPQFQALREFYNPVYGLLSPHKKPFFDRPENEKYNKNSFLMNLNNVKDNIIPAGNFQVDKEQLKDDELGLFAGVSITRFFKNHPCIGVPITANKESTEKLHAYAKFFEWFNAHELEDMFTHESRGSKEWKLILVPAVKQLRSRILAQLKNEKLVINMDSLFTVYNGLTSQLEEKDRYLVYTDIYGTRKLPLDGLFFDVEDEGKDREILAYIEQVLEVFRHKTKVNLETYRDAKKFTADLWSVYSTMEGDLEKRFKLSEYLASQQSGSGMLKDKIDHKHFQSLKEHFGYDPGTNILTKNTLELTDQKEESVRRLVVLFTYLHLSNQEKMTLQQLDELDEKGTLNNFRQLMEVNLTSRDLLLALFPVPAKRPIMDIHMDLLPEEKRQKGRSLFETQRQALRDINIGLSNSLKFDKITASDYYLLKVYANENNLTIPNNLSYGPQSEKREKWKNTGFHMESQAT